MLTSEPAKLFYNYIRRRTTELSARERVVVQLIAYGYFNKEIADQLRISVKTVEKHRESVYHKLKLHSAVYLTHWAVSQGLVSVVDFTQTDAPPSVKDLTVRKFSRANQTIHTYEI
jgi:DNA-binding NarL/FixJ family response regulator